MSHVFWRYHLCKNKESHFNNDELKQENFLEVLMSILN